MSNESENERIDLTQFDGHTEGEWGLPSGRGSFNEHSIWTWGVIDILQKCRYGRPGYEDNIMDGKLAMSAPKLLAELKRMYESEDEMTFRLMQVLKERKDLRDQLQNLLAEVDEASK